MSTTTERRFVQDVMESRGLDEAGISGFLVHFLNSSHPELVDELETFITESMAGDDRATSCPHCKVEILQQDMEEDWCTNCGKDLLG